MSDPQDSPELRPIYEFQDAVAFVAQWTGLDPALVARVLEAKERYLILAGIAQVEEDEELRAERARYRHLLPETPDFIDERETEYVALVTGCAPESLSRIDAGDLAYQDTLDLIGWGDDAERDQALGAPALPEPQEEGPRVEEGHAGHWSLAVPDMDAYIEAELRGDPEARHLRYQAPSPQDRWRAVTAYGVPQTPALETGWLTGEQEGTYEFITLYPIVRDGAAHDLRLQRALVWAEGCEAIVQATTVSGYPLAYFDTAYLHPRNDWAPGDQAEVELAAFVITLAPVPAGVLGPFDPRSVPAVRACQTGTAPGDAAAQDGEPLDGGKANFLLPSTGARANPDEFVFQGPVLSVDVTEAWGQLLYRLEVTVMAVMRAGVLEPFTLPLYVGKHRLKGAPPKAGDRIRGLLWLQGRRAFRSPECDRH